MLKRRQVKNVRGIIHYPDKRCYHRIYLNERRFIDGKDRAWTDRDVSKQDRIRGNSAPEINV